MPRTCCCTSTGYLSRGAAHLGELDRHGGRAVDGGGDQSRASRHENDFVIDRDGMERRFTAADLLARPDNALVTVQDSTVGRPTKYRAVLLLALLGDISDARFDTLEARAID